MDSKKLRLVLLGLLGLGAIAFVTILFIGTSALDAKSKSLIKLKLEDKTAEAQLASLAIAKKDVEAYAYFKDVAKTVIPNDKNQAQAVLDIIQLANAAGINIESITFPASTLGSAAAAAAAAQTTPTNAQSASAKSVLSQAKAVEGISGLYAVELTISPESGGQVPADKQVTYAKFLDFIKKLENNRRTAQITQISILPSGDESGPSGQISFSLTINIFIKP